jgi:hypothetical protein
MTIRTNLSYSWSKKSQAKGDVNMPRRGESIYKRKDGRWEARYIHHYENGHAKYRYLYGKTYAEVKARRVKEMAHPDSVIVTSARQRTSTLT